ncbi:MAG: hypothetical protein QXR17_08085 [Candidatus Bathyarchaeia archaeon]
MRIMFLVAVLLASLLLPNPINGLKDLTIQTIISRPRNDIFCSITANETVVIV